MPSGAATGTANHAPDERCLAFMGGATMRAFDQAPLEYVTDHTATDRHGRRLPYTTTYEPSEVVVPAYPPTQPPAGSVARTGSLHPVGDRVLEVSHW